MLLNESGIRLPKGTKSATILTHRDLDGFVSGLLVYNQLIRQGIPAERINIKFVQYGDNDILDKATRKNKNQAILSCDFSAFPKINMEDSWNGFAKTYDKEKDRNFSPDKSASYESFKKQFINSKPSFKTISDFLKKNNPNAVLFAKPKDSSVRISLENFINGWKSHKGNDDVALTDLDWTSDHHSNEKGDLVPGKSGKIGANYPSDSEHIATVAAQGLMNWDDIEAVSRVDSAKYKNLKDVLSLPSALGSKDRKERLAILITAMIGPIVSNNDRLAELMIKRSTPSLISIYNNALKIAKLTDNELKVLSELKNEKPDWNLINELTKDLPEHEKKKLLQNRDENKKIKPVQSVDALRNKNINNIEREKKIDKSDFKFYGNIAVFESRVRTDQPSRYLFAFLEHEGKQPAFSIRKFPGMGMIQVSCSPLLSEKDKESIDLEAVCKDAIKAAKEKGLLNDFTEKLILQKSGGHKAIYNLSNLGIVGNITPTPGERYRIKDLTDYENRRKALYKNAVSELTKKNAKALPNKGKELESLKSIKSKANKEVYDFLVDYIIRELKSRYGNIQPKLSDFKIKMEN